MSIQKIYSLLFLLIPLCVLAQRPAPAPAQTETIAITNATIHTATGEVIENGNIVFENGKIISINQTFPSNAKVIDATGKHVYPGFILVNSTLGLVEIAATKSTVDFREANGFTPEVRTKIAFNTDSHIIPTVRTNGILLTQPVMKSGTLTGTSSVMNLDGWNWEDATIAHDNGLHLFWPRMWKSSDPKRNQELQERRAERMTKIQSLFERAKAYSPKGEIKDFKLEAIQPIFTGEKILFVETPNANETLEVLELAKTLEIPKVVLIGRSNLLPVLDEIKASGFPLIIHRVHSLPTSSSTTPNLPFEFAKMVSDKGILYGLDFSGDMEFQVCRNLPFSAGTTAAYGLNKETALQSISLNLARILGIDDRYGSLEVGKSATLFISEGDALDQLTNKVTHAFIDGREIDLDNQQKELYRRYKAKYEAQ